jgi:hypothetical protein
LFAPGFRAGWGPVNGPDVENQYIKALDLFSRRFEFCIVVVTTAFILYSLCTGNYRSIV